MDVNGSWTQTPERSDYNPNINPNQSNNPYPNSEAGLYDVTKPDNPFQTIDKNNQIEVGPNPTSGGWSIIIHSIEKSTATISLYDISGKEILSDFKYLVQGTNTIVLSAKKLTPGFYFMKIKGESIEYRKKLIKN